MGLITEILKTNDNLDVNVATTTTVQPSDNNFWKNLYTNVNAISLANPSIVAVSAALKAVFAAHSGVNQDASIKISVGPQGWVDLSTKETYIAADVYNKSNIYDNNETTYAYDSYIDYGEIEDNIIWDLGEVADWEVVAKLYAADTNLHSEILISTDNANWTTLFDCTNGYLVGYKKANFRYIKWRTRNTTTSLRYSGFSNLQLYTLNIRKATYALGGANFRLANTGSTVTQTFQFQGFAYLPAGTYTVFVDVNVYDAGYVTAGFDSLYIGHAQLSDTQGTTGLVNLSSGGSSTILTSNPITRRTVMGPINKVAALFMVGVHVANTTAFQGLVDGAEPSTGRTVTQCVENGQAFTWKQYWVYLDPSAQHTFAVKQSTGAAQDVYYALIVCPWVVASTDFTPIIVVDVPGQSTLYGVIEDMFDRGLAKDAVIIKQQVIDGLTTVASWSQAASQNPLVFNYTLEMFTSQIFLAVKNLWTCLSALGVDFR
jgi:hypothetical protein